MSNSSTPRKPWKPGPFKWSGVIGRETAVVWIPGHGDVIVDVVGAQSATAWSWKVVDSASGKTVAEGVRVGSTGRERAITSARKAVTEYAAKVRS